MDRENEGAQGVSGSEWQDAEDNRLGRQTDTANVAAASSEAAPIQVAQADPATDTQPGGPAITGLNVLKDNAPIIATYTAKPGVKINLPEGASIDTMLVRGDDLILIQEDGSIILILDGAKYPPELVWEGVEIPSQVVAQIVENATPGVPTAGPETSGNQTQSSGGEFSIYNGNIGDPFPIGDLLPPTELQFFVPEVREEILGVRDEEGGPGLPPVIDLIPEQVAGASVGGIVEEEHLQRERPASPAQWSEGNEDEDDDNDLDGDTPLDPNVTTITFSGSAANGQSLQNLVKGGDQPISFSLRNVQNQIVHDTTGANVTSQGDTVRYHLVDANHLIGYADENSSNTFDGAQNPGTTSFPIGDDRIVFELEVLPNGNWTLTIYDQLDHAFADQLEGLLSINLTEVIKATDGNGSVLIFSGNAFTVGVIDDVPILTGETEHRTVDEDDIHTPWSHGTSPNDGPGDGSTTENSSGAAFISGNLSDLVSIGADDLDQYFQEGGSPTLSRSSASRRTSSRRWRP